MPPQPERSRSGLWVLGLSTVLLLAAGIILALYTFTVEPTGTGQEVIVRVAGDQFSASVAGETITATNALYSSNTPESVVQSQCGGNLEGASLVAGKLTNDVIVVRSSDAGVVCIGQGTTQTVGPVEVTARSMAETANDNKGRTYKDPDGNTIYFRELGIRAVGSTRNNLQNLIAGVLIAVGAGLGAGLLVESLARRRPRGSTNHSSVAQ